MSVATGQPARTYDPVSISPLSFWADTAAGREKSFKILRDERPISWHPPIDGALMVPEIDGVWAVTRHEDISYVSKNPELFCSGQGVMIEAVPEDILDAAQSFLAMDGAKHSTLRRLVSSVFTPRQVSKIQDQIETQATQIVDELLVDQGGRLRRAGLQASSDVDDLRNDGPAIGVAGGGRPQRRRHGVLGRRGRRRRP